MNGPYLSLSLTLSVCCLYYRRLMGAEVIVPGVNWAENEVVLGGWGGGSRVVGWGVRSGWSGWIRARRHYSERPRRKTDLSAKAHLSCVGGRGPDVRW